MIQIVRSAPAVLAVLLTVAAGAAAAESHAAKGMTVELVADAASVAPGQPLNLGIAFRPQAGFHTYWRQPGLVGLTPTVEWNLPKELVAGALLWPEPQRGKMGVYGVWCLRRDVALVTPVRISPDLDPAKTPEVTLKAKVVWMACSRTCHPGTAELSLTLPVRPVPEAAGKEAVAQDVSVQEASSKSEAGTGAALIEATLREQPVTDERWQFAAVRHGTDGGYSLTITPPAGMTVPEDAYFYGHQRLVDSNVEPGRVVLAGGAVRIDLAPVEEPDPTPEVLLGELWSAQGWGGEKSQRLLRVRAPLRVASDAR